MRLMSNESGVSSVKVMIWLVILGAGFHVGIKYLFGPA